MKRVIPTPERLLNLYVRMTDDRKANDPEDPRREEIVQEMRAVLSGDREKTRQAIEWWGWESPQKMWAWTRKVRKAADKDGLICASGGNEHDDCRTW